MKFFNTYKNKWLIGGVLSLLLVGGVIALRFELSNERDQSTPLVKEELPNTQTPEVSQTVDSPVALDSIVEFDLGELNVNGVDGENINVNLKGKLALPKSDGENPIVFLLPQSADYDLMQEEYNHILDEIASLNYFGVFLDVKDLIKKQSVDFKVMQQVFDAYRVELVKALAGETSAFNLELDNLGTLSDVIFISYGDSLETTYSIIEDQISKQQFNLNRLLFINPIRKTELTFSYPDVFTSFLIDDHVSSEERMGSQSIFEEYRQEKSRKSVTNYMLAQNVNLTNVEASVSELEQENKIVLEDVIVSKEDIMSFIRTYVNGFLSTSGDDSQFNLDQTLLENQIPIKVKTSTLVPNMLRLINPTIETQPTLNTLGGENILSNLSLRVESDLLSTFKFNIEAYPASFKMMIPTEQKDLSHYDLLSLYVSTVSNTKTTERSIPKFTVRLVDTSGNVSSVEAVMTPNDYTPTLSPFCLSDVSIKLSSFTSIDMSEISAIELVFEDQFAYDVRLGDIALIK